jgi:hypothetical protein
MAAKKNTTQHPTPANPRPQTEAMASKPVVPKGRKVLGAQAPKPTSTKAGKRTEVSVAPWNTNGAPVPNRNVYTPDQTIYMGTNK